MSAPRARCATPPRGSVPSAIARRQPVVWRRDGEPWDAPGLLVRAHLDEALARWARLAPLLERLFGSAALAQGEIDSPLLAVPALVRDTATSLTPAGLDGRVYVKGDHALPLAGSIKARGGIYAVLCIAERAALAAGLVAANGDRTVLASAQARAFFAQRGLVVGSTGNLGFAVGLAARALGFRTTVHMSRDAKPWKKERLRALGASVVEHAADYGVAVAHARAEALAAGDVDFIDDERSRDLFLGYASAAPQLAAQLRRHGVGIDAAHPLCIYLPCGVGGAPAGVLFGLRAILGRYVWGFFAEPVASPSMLLRLAGAPAGTTVYDLGLDNVTVADGLAVARASDLAYDACASAVMGAYTVGDEELLGWVDAAWRCERLRLEPSAAAGFPGALRRAWRAPEFDGLRDRLARATHVVWTTGGSLLPDEEFEAVLAAAAQLPAEARL